MNTHRDKNNLSKKIEKQELGKERKPCREEQMRTRAVVVVVEMVVMIDN